MTAFNNLTEFQNEVAAIIGNATGEGSITPTIHAALLGRVGETIFRHDGFGENIKNFGVVGDDPGDFTGTDDTVNMNAAFGSGKNIVMPVGFYKVTNTLTITEGTKIRGAGIGKTVILFPKGFQSGGVVMRPNTCLDDISIEEYDFDQFDVNKESASGIGLNCNSTTADGYLGSRAVGHVSVKGFSFPLGCKGSDWNTFSNCEFANSLFWGAELDNSQNVLFYRCSFHHNGWDGFKAQSQQPTDTQRSCNGSILLSCIMEDNGQRDFNAPNGIETANGNGADIFDGGNQMFLENCIIRRNYGSGIVLKGNGNQTGESLIRGCQIYDNIRASGGGGHGLEFGIQVSYNSRNMTVDSCNIYNNEGSGVLVHGGYGMKLSNCNIARNWIGINLQSGIVDFHVTGCNVQGNFDFNIICGTIGSASTLNRRWTFNNCLITGVYNPYGDRPELLNDKTDTFTADASMDILAATAHPFSDNDCVSLRTTGTLPSGLKIRQLYYIVNSAANTFQLSLERGGAVIDILDAGSGTHTISCLHTEWCLRVYDQINDVRFTETTFFPGWTSNGLYIDGNRVNFTGCKIMKPIRRGVTILGNDVVLDDCIFADFTGNGNQTFDAAVYVGGTSIGVELSRNKFLQVSEEADSIAVLIKDTADVKLHGNKFENWTNYIVADKNTTIDLGVLDLEHENLSNNEDITTYLQDLIDKFFKSASINIKLPKSVSNLNCGNIIWPSDLNQFNLLAGNCTITQVDENLETMWLFDNPKNFLIESGVKFIGVVEAANFTDPSNGLIKITGAAKSGIGGSIESHADFEGSTSTGLSIAGVTSESNAYQKVLIYGEYKDSGVYAPSYSIERKVDIQIYDAPTNIYGGQSGTIFQSATTAIAYNSGQPGSRRYEGQPPIVQSGYAPLLGRFPLSQGNYDRDILVEYHRGHHEFEDMLGVNSNNDAKIFLEPGSVWNLGDTVRIPSGVTITTDKNNPATIVHPLFSQGCLGLNGAGITIENIVMDFKMGPIWREFQTCIASTTGSFFVGDGADLRRIVFDNESNGPFRVGEAITFTGGGGGQIISLVDGAGTDGTIFVAFSTGTAPVNNNTITGTFKGTTAMVNGSPTLQGSVPQHPIEDILIDSVIFINSDRTRRNYTGTDVNFNYINGTAPFLEGEPISFSNGGSGTLFQLVSNGGSTGSMVVIYTGNAPVNGTGLTGGTSGATANINGAPTFNSQGGDSWCISFASSSGGIWGRPIRNFRVVNCVGLARDCQLTANGSNAIGFDGVYIENNYTENGYANPIALSSLSTNVTIKNLYIRNNLIVNCRSAGIYVGLDPPAGGTIENFVSMEDIVVEGNKIVFEPVSTGVSGSFAFPIACIFRCTGNAKRIQFRNNTMDFTALNALPFTSERFIDFRGDPVGPDNTFLLRDNNYLGLAGFAIGQPGDVNMGYVQYFDELPLEDSLVASWPLDEASGIAIDEFHKEHNGINFNGTTEGGSVGQVLDGPNSIPARNFVAANLQHFRIPHSPELEGNIGKSMSWNVFVRFTTVAASQGIFGKGTNFLPAGSTGIYRLWFDHTVSRLKFQIQNGSFSSTAIADNFGVVSAGVWLNINCWFNAETHQVGISVNDGEPNVIDSIGSLATLLTNFTIGSAGSSGGSVSYFNGDMSRLRYWKGRELAQRDRLALWNNGDSKPFNEFDQTILEPAIFDPHNDFIYVDDFAGTDAEKLEAAVALAQATFPSGPVSPTIVLSPRVYSIDLTTTLKLGRCSVKVNGGIGRRGANLNFTGAIESQTLVSCIGGFGQRIENIHITQGAAAAEDVVGLNISSVSSLTMLDVEIRMSGIDSVGLLVTKESGGNNTESVAVDGLTCVASQGIVMISGDNISFKNCDLTVVGLPTTWGEFGGTDRGYIWSPIALQRSRSPLTSSHPALDNISFENVTSQGGNVCFYARSIASGASIRSGGRVVGYRWEQGTEVEFDENYNPVVGGALGYQPAFVCDLIGTLQPLQWLELQGLRFSETHKYGLLVRGIRNKTLVNPFNASESIVVPRYNKSIGMDNLGTVSDYHPQSQISYPDSIVDVQTPATSFDGTSDSVTIPGGLGITTAGSHTIAVWMRTNSIANQAIVNYATSGTNRIGINISGGRISAGYYDGGYKGAIRSTVLSESWYRWVHIALVNTSGSVALFIDGLEQTDATQGTGLGSLDIADKFWGNAGSLYFSGNLFDGRIYTSALTPSEIGYLALNGTGGTDHGVGDLVEQAMIS